MCQFSYQFLIYLVVLISGGIGINGILQSVEIYNPASNTSCSLPSLPEARYDHTQDGELACGGWGGYPTNATTTCVKWNSDSGTWTHSHTLRQSKASHMSWATEDGVYLLGGGAYQKNTSELVKVDGSVEDGFSLKYDTL